MKHKKLFFATVIFLISISSFSQNGKIQLNQDPKLTELMKLKKEVNQEDFTSGQYTIQVYNGTYEKGTELMKMLIVENEFKDIIFSFETPYYKVRIGKYVSKIKAVKELKNIKKKFPSAFILKPN